MLRKSVDAGLEYYGHLVNKQNLGIVLVYVWELENNMFSYSASHHVVYRVLELPSSMQSLVYDFGQLDHDTEKDYAKKIVEKYVRL